jgi:hypothetical protein
LFFFVFPSLAHLLNFPFFSVSSFVCVICRHLFSFSSFPLPSTFRSLCLIHASFPVSFYSLFLSSLSDFKFFPSLLYFSPPLIQRFFLSSCFYIFPFLA